MDEFATLAPPVGELDGYRISHSFTVHRGAHASNRGSRFQDEVIPIFSRNRVFP